MEPLRHHPRRGLLVLVIAILATVALPAGSPVQAASTPLLENLTAPANAAALEVSTSADGNIIVFSSAASSLTRDPDNRQVDVFRIDRSRGTIQNLTAGGNGPSTNPHVSADGTVVVFESTASNLAADRDRATDVFRWKAGEIANLTNRSARPHTNPRPSADGSTVVFTRNLGESNTLSGAEKAIVWSASKGRSSTIINGGGGTQALDVSADGQTVFLKTTAARLVDRNLGPFDHTDLIRWSLADRSAELVASAEFVGFIDDGRLSADGSIAAFTSGAGSRPFRSLSVSTAGRTTTFDGSANLHDLSLDGQVVLLSGTATSEPPTVWHWATDRRSVLETSALIDGSLSGDGAMAAVVSAAPLNPQDHNQVADVFVWDVDAEPDHSPSIQNLTVSDVSPWGATVSFGTNNCTGARYVITSANGLWSSIWQDGLPVEQQCWTAHRAEFGRAPFSVPLYRGVTYNVTIEVTDSMGRTTTASTSFTTN